MRPSIKASYICLSTSRRFNGEAGTPSVGSSDSLSTSAGQLQIELQSPAGAAAKGAATESLRGDVSDAKGAATAPLRGDVSDVLATIEKASKTPKGKKDKATTAMKKKTKTDAMKAIRTMKAMRTAKGVVKTTMKATRVTAMGVRGEKDAAKKTYRLQQGRSHPQVTYRLQ